MRQRFGQRWCIKPQVFTGRFAFRDLSTLADYKFGRITTQEVKICIFLSAITRLYRPVTNTVSLVVFVPASKEISMQLHIFLSRRSRIQSAMYSRVAVSLPP